MNKVYICGLEASAKGTLRALLDGHPKIIDNPFDIGISLLDDGFYNYCKRPVLEYDRRYISQDAIQDKLITIIIKGEVCYLSIGQLFAHLFKSKEENSALFDCSITGKINGPEIYKRFLLKDIQFDVFKFLKDTAQKITTKKNYYSVEEIQDDIYECLILNCKEMQENYNHDSLFVQGSYTGYKIIKDIFMKNRNKKIIAVKRDPISLLFTLTKREICKLPYAKKDVKLNSSIEFSRFLNAIRKEHVQMIKEYNDKVYNLNNVSEDIYLINVRATKNSYKIW